jgi:hypothetical protein
VDGVGIAVSIWFAGSILALIGWNFAVLAWLSARQVSLEFMSLRDPRYVAQKYRDYCDQHCLPERGVVTFLTLTLASVVMSTFFFIGLVSGLPAGRDAAVPGAHATKP